MCQPLSPGCCPTYAISSQPPPQGANGLGQSTEPGRVTVSLPGTPESLFSGSNEGGAVMPHGLGSAMETPGWLSSLCS